MIAYSWKFNNLWYGTSEMLYFGKIMTPLILIQPINYAVLQGIKKIAACLSLSQEFDQVSSESVFFVCPKNPLTNFLWQFLKDFSTFVTNFMICGTNSDAIANTMYESLDKYFWRDLLENSGANIARELGRFENGQLTMYEEVTNKDVVLKLADSYLGIGDKFLQFGKDFTNQGDLEQLIKSEPMYSQGGSEVFGKSGKVLLISWIRPKEDLGVHSLDILTINSSDEGFKVSILLQII